MEPQEVHNICRFCLCQDEHLLCPITRTLSASLTLEDVGQFTGIKINAKESMSFAICFKCADTLRSCASFRQSCMNNDAQFQELLEVLIASVQSIPCETVAPLSVVARDLVNLHVEVNHYDDDDDSDCNAVVIDDDDDAWGDDDDDNNYFNRKTQKAYKEIENYSANKIDIGECLSSDNEEPECQFDFPEALNRKADEIVRPSQEEDQEVRAINTKRTRNSYARQKLCSECGKLVTNFSYHNQLHRNEKKHACPHCPIKMTCKGNLVKHINAVHLKLVCRTCKLCGKGFTSNNSHVSHMLSVHGIGEKLQCTVCSRLFNRRANLDDHMKGVHSNVRSFECDICGLLFKMKYSLAIHMRVHSTEQPYQCRKCPKRFKSSYAKKIHETAHSGIVFECAICDKTYRYKSLLNIHIRKQHPTEANAHEEDSEGHSMSNT